MQLPAFLLLLCLLALASCRHYDNVYQLLEAKGFSGKGYLICQIRKGNVLKNVNEDELTLLETLKRSKIVDKIAVLPAYTIYFETGGFSECQTITIYTGASGDGYVDYHCWGRKVTFFSCPDLPKFCEEAFNRSQIFPGKWHQPNKALQPTPPPVALLFFMSYPRVLKPRLQRRG
jgi:hypothetical protein